MDIVQRVRQDVHETLGSAPRVVLAVSGGLDSMVLLDAAARTVPSRIRTVATFDHGTGAAARAAVRHVRTHTRALGLPFRSAAARGVAERESAWRDARWRFLRAIAAESDAVVATGHTLDDHLETVVMRALRGAGARGLAGLHAGQGVVRPLLGFRRRELAAYAAAAHVSWVEDPSNASTRFFRNRVRRDLLPALELAQPDAAAMLSNLAERAWALRMEVEAFIDQHVKMEQRGDVLRVARADLAGYDRIQLGLLWPAIAGRMGLALDRRGTERVSVFTIRGTAGHRIPVSGRFEVVRQGDWLAVRPERDARALAASRRLNEGLSLGEWQFRQAEHAGADAVDLWWAYLPRSGRVAVRGWRPGDRMIPHGSTRERRLRGLFRDAGVDAAERRAWPVVVVDEQIVWVPGVRRSTAATDRSGRPLVLYHCERHHR